MTRKILVAATLLLLLASTGFAQSSSRTPGDFVREAIDSFDLDSVQQQYVEGERMGENYRFYPAVRDGRVVGYVWWTKDIKIANHFEDVLLLITARNGEATLSDFWISHNDHHLNMSEAATKQQFAGMNYDRDWDEDVDVISGSTLSSYQIFAQFKTALFVFQNYVIDAGLL